MKYPRPPTKKEREIWEEEAEREEMEELFQKMYGYKEESDED